MSDDFAKTVLDILKLAPRYLVSLSIATAFLLFGPDKWNKGVGAYDFTQHYRQYISIVFILTTILFTVDRTIAVFGWIRQRMRRVAIVAKAPDARLKRLNNLTEDEKQILRFYFAKETRSNVLRIDDGTVNGLVSVGIIFRSASLGSMLEGFAHNITDFAWDYLSENPHLLYGTTNTYRTDKMNW